MPLFARRMIVLLGAALLALPASILAQQTATVSGLVSDQTGASVVGAKVELLGGPDGTRATTTDSAGRYRFEGLRPGDHTVRVTAPAFRTAGADRRALRF